MRRPCTILAAAALAAIPSLAHAQSPVRESADAISLSGSSAGSYRSKANDWMIMPKGMTTIGGHVKFIISEAGLGPDGLKLTDVMITSLNIRAAVTRRIELFGSLSFLPKQPSFTDESAWQSASAGAMLGFHKRFAAYATGGTGPLLDDRGIDDVADAQQVKFTRMNKSERLAADFGAMGVSVDDHPMTLMRPQLLRAGVRSAEDINRRGKNGDRARIGGMIITRQRPGSAKGMMFITLEDETGLANLVITPPVFDRYRTICRGELLILAHGVLERQERVINLLVDHLEKLRPAEGKPPPSLQSRDFR